MTKELFNRARALAIHDGFEDLAEDFAQEACMTLGRGRKATLRQLLTDYLRKELGDTRLKGKVPVLDLHGPLAAPDRAKLVVPALDPERFDFDNYLTDLDQLDKAILILRYKWGLDLHEIGHVFGLTEGRVCQIVKETEKVLRKRILYGTLSHNAQ